MKVAVPDGGWSRETFIKHGAELIRDLMKLQRYVTGRRRQAAANDVERVLSKQLDTFLARAEQKSVKAGLDLEITPTQSFWDTLMLSVFNAESAAEVGEAIKPHITSMLMQGYTKVAPVMDVAVVDEVMRSQIPRMAQGMAEEIKDVTITTKLRVQSVIDRALKDKLTVRETVQLLREKVPSIVHSRAVMIARTELINAYTRGNVYAYQQSNTITHVSVIGCDGVNDSSHTWNGRHTCNISDVPVENAHELRFHPNHTGTLVPSRFIG